MASLPLFFFDNIILTHVFFFKKKTCVLVLASIYSLELTLQSSPKSLMGLHSGE